MDVDEALAYLGKFGKWQLLNYSLLGMSVAWPAAWHLYAFVFTGITPEHTCNVSPPNVTRKFEAVLEKQGYGQLAVSSCFMYNGTLRQGAPKVPCMFGYTYSPTQMTSTIVTEWDLVCGQEGNVDTVQLFFFLGALVSAIPHGVLADHFGRKYVHLGSLWGLTILGVATAFAPNYYLHVTLRAITGALYQGVFIGGFVLLTEFFPRRSRLAAMTGFQLFWSSGMLLLLLLAFLIAHWNFLMLSISLPFVLAISYVWLIGESVPWSVANEELSQAEFVLKRGAKMNRIKYPHKKIFRRVEDVIRTSISTVPSVYESSLAGADGNDSVFTDGDTSLANCSTMSAASSTSRRSRYQDSDIETTFSRENLASLVVNRKTTLLELLRSNIARSYLLIVIYLWFVHGSLYWSLYLVTSNMTDNVFLSFLIFTILEIPAPILCLFLVPRFGRKRPLCACVVLAGLLTASSLITHSVSGPLGAVYALGALGKMAVSGVTTILLPLSVELFPTTVRAKCFAIASTMGVVGCLLGRLGHTAAQPLLWLPGVVYGVVAIPAGLLVYLLPETINKPLPELLDELRTWEQYAFSPSLWLRGCSSCMRAQDDDVTNTDDLDASTVSGANEQENVCELCCLCFSKHDESHNRTSKPKPPPNRPPHSEANGSKERTANDIEAKTRPLTSENTSTTPVVYDSSLDLRISDSLDCQDSGLSGTSSLSNVPVSGTARGAISSNPSGVVSASSDSGMDRRSSTTSNKSETAV